MNKMVIMYSEASSPERFFNVIDTRESFLHHLLGYFGSNGIQGTLGTRHVPDRYPKEITVPYTP